MSLRTEDIVQPRKVIKEIAAGQGVLMKRGNGSARGGAKTGADSEIRKPQRLSLNTHDIEGATPRLGCGERHHKFKDMARKKREYIEWLSGSPGRSGGLHVELDGAGGGLVSL